MAEFLAGYYLVLTLGAGVCIGAGVTQYRMAQRRMAELVNSEWWPVVNEE